MLRAIEHAGDRDYLARVPSAHASSAPVAGQVAERLPQQDFVTFDLREIPGKDDLSPAAVAMRS